MHLKIETWEQVLAIHKLIPDFFGLYPENNSWSWRMGCGSIDMAVEETIKIAKWLNRNQNLVFNGTIVEVSPNSSVGDCCRIYHLMREVDHLKRGLKPAERT